jgi:Fic family protein
MELDQEQQRRLVRTWTEYGPIIEAIRFEELARLDEDEARRATSELLDLAVLEPIPRERWQSSGLVELQAAFHPAEHR